MMRVEHGDCLEVMRALGDRSVDACVTDPPYGLRFMGRGWDYDVPTVEMWREVFRVLKPGAHLIAFSGTRTYHRMACAIEDAGFEIRDQIGWLYGSGFPKSHDVSKGIDRAAGAEREVVGVAGKSGSARSCMAGDFTGGEYMATAPATDAAKQWQGWGTALKPAWEPICLARKPLIGTVAANVIAHGTGAINIDGCRIGEDQTTTIRSGHSGDNGIYGSDSRKFERLNPPGRWPANVIHDGSEDVLEAFAAYGERASGVLTTKSKARGWDGDGGKQEWAGACGDAGTAARFFYSAKADADDRLGSKHPTVKPVDLMAYLCRLVTPPGGLVLDPFAGSGTTGMACLREGFRCILIEREAEYVADIRKRLAHVKGEDTPLFGGAA
jgi:DNA modification methylase